MIKDSRIKVMIINRLAVAGFCSGELKVGNLPKDAEIVDIREGPLERPRELWLYVRSAEFDEVLEGCVYPSFNAEFRTVNNSSDADLLRRMVTQGNK